MKGLLPILLFLILITAGCYSIETVESTKVSSNDVYQSYAVKADKTQTSVSAVFRVGEKSGATIDLDAPSKIEHNGKLMSEIAPNSWKGTTYEDSTNKFVGNHQFIYTDSNGKTLLNEITLEPLEFRDNSFKANRAGKTLIPLTRSVGENENILAYLTGKGKTKNSSTDSVEVRLDSSRSAIVIEPDSLKDLADGKANLSLKVEKTISFKQGDAKGGDIKISYEAQEITLYIVE